MQKVSVVILNWNGWKDTVDCLKSIQKSKATNFVLEIVVVDNASTNESVEKIKEVKMKNFHLIENDTNLGFAGGNNVGIEFALALGSDYVCVLNNDTIVGKHLFERLLKAAHDHPKAGAISPKIYFSKHYEFHKDRYKNNELGKVIWYAGGNIDWANIYGSNHGVDEVDRGQFDDDRLTDFATGACIFMSKVVLEQVGLFDEKYYLYMEDADLCMRMKKAGYEVWYAHKPTVWHRVSQSSGIGSNLNDYFISRNRMIFGMRYASLRTKYALSRESFRFILFGRHWQRRGVIDYYRGNLGKGSWQS
jgi:GT2 family glycosyltransferase